MIRILHHSPKTNEKPQMTIEMDSYDFDNVIDALDTINCKTVRGTTEKQETEEKPEDKSFEYLQCNQYWNKGT